MKDQELILRFLALNDGLQKYSGTMTMKKFLNDFMASHRYVSGKVEKGFSSAFLSAIRFVHEHLNSRAFRLKGRLNAAVFDAVMVGVANRLVRAPITDGSRFNKAYQQLLASEEFLAAATSGTSQAANVNKRIDLAVRAFKSLR